MSKKNITPDYKPIWTPEFVYFLGFAWADGYLWSSEKHRRYSLILENLFDDLNSLLPYFKGIGHFILYPLFKKLSPNKFLRATISSKSLFEYLKLHGYRDKCSAHIIIHQIPQELRYHFWRGLFDGDGTAGLYPRKTRNSSDIKCSICSNINQDWSELEKTALELNLNFKIKKQIQKGAGKHSSFDIEQSESAVLFGDYLYGDLELNIPFLKRKREKFIEITNHYHQSDKFKIQQANLTLKPQVFDMLEKGMTEKDIKLLIKEKSGFLKGKNGRFLQEWMDEFNKIKMIP